MSVPQLYFIKSFFYFYFLFCLLTCLVDTAAAGVCSRSCVSQVEYKFHLQSEEVLVRIGVYLAVRVRGWFVFLCFLHIEHQNTYYNSKVRTFLECEDISAVVYDC